MKADRDTNDACVSTKDSRTVHANRKFQTVKRRFCHIREEDLRMSDMDEPATKRERLLGCMNATDLGGNYVSSRARSRMPNNAQLYAVLSRFTPERRRKAISSLLSESQRRDLEDWLVAGGRHRKRIPTFTVGRHYNRSSDWARRIYGSPVDSEASFSPHNRPRGLVLYSQRSQVTGKVSLWYYAVVCLPGLHIVGRMHREPSRAFRDHRALQNLKRGTLAALSRGFSFDDSLRASFRANDLMILPCDSNSQSPKEDPSISSMLFASKRDRASYPLPTLRFYAVMTLGNGYKTLVRSPCLHDLEVALTARRRLLTVGNVAQLSLMSHSECVEMLLRVRQEHAALHQEHGPSRGVHHAIARFRSIESTILEQRDRSAWLHLRRLLAQKGRSAFPYKLICASELVVADSVLPSPSFLSKHRKWVGVEEQELKPSVVTNGGFEVWV